MRLPLWDVEIWVGGQGYSFGAVEAFNAGD